MCALVDMRRSCSRACPCVAPRARRADTWRSASCTANCSRSARPRSETTKFFARRIGCVFLRLSVRRMRPLTQPSKVARLPTRLGRVARCDLLFCSALHRPPLHCLLLPCTVLHRLALYRGSPPCTAVIFCVGAPCTTLSRCALFLCFVCCRDVQGARVQVSPEDFKVERLTAGDWLKCVCRNLQRGREFTRGFGYALRLFAPPFA